MRFCVRNFFRLTIFECGFDFAEIFVSKVLTVDFVVSYTPMSKKSRNTVPLMHDSTFLDLRGQVTVHTLRNVLFRLYASLIEQQETWLNVL